MALDKKPLLRDVNLAGQPQPLPTPSEVLARMPINEAAAETVYEAREGIKKILDGQDSRKVLVIGPCSIHSSGQAVEYARLLNGLADEVKDEFLVAMRAYVEKPRTGVGWPGLMDDPALDGSFDMEKGIYLSRRFLLDIAELGMPAAVEAVSSSSPQYISDLVSWACIGARTAESQEHRKLASGLSMPVGIKNGTNGELEAAVDGLTVIRHPNCFHGMDMDGRRSKVSTTGNRYSHIVLRGGARNGDKITNYYAASVQKAQGMLRDRGLAADVMIDCSHGNSQKDYKRQPAVFMDVVGQIRDGNEGIIGLMLESNINEGKQDIKSRPLVYGVSVTDGCVSFETTKEIVMEAYWMLKGRK